MYYIVLMYHKIQDYKEEDIAVNTTDSESNIWKTFWLTN